MNKVAIITSIDYELFGDGTGNVTREQIDTTNYIKHLAEEHNVKLTIMFEYAQYRAYEKYTHLNKKLKKDNQNIKNQLIELCKSGHDIQLHYHAQWHNAKYNTKTNSFDLDLTKIDISSLTHKTIVSILKEGKSFLENLLQRYNPDYKCIAFRAGSWAVKDEKKLTNALQIANFKIDTSVVPNVKFEEGFISFEYKNCPHSYHYWFVENEISKTSNKHNLLEIPIYTIKSRFSLFYYFNLKSLMLKILLKKLYKKNIAKGRMSFIQKTIKILSRNYYMADINVLTHKTLFNMIKKVMNDNSFKDEKIVPIMLVGHSKASYNMEDLHILYNTLQKKYGNNIEYWTLQDLNKSIWDNER